MKTRNGFVSNSSSSSFVLSPAAIRLHRRNRIKAVCRWIPFVLALCGLAYLLWQYPPQVFH